MVVDEAGVPAATARYCGKDLHHAGDTLRRMQEHLANYMECHRSVDIGHPYRLREIQRIREGLEQAGHALAKPLETGATRWLLRKGARALQDLRSLNHALLSEGLDLIYASDNWQGPEVKALREAIRILQAVAGEMGSIDARQLAAAGYF